MSYIYEWMTNIILIILLATILELLLPSSAYQKYIKVVIGLLLILAILKPIIELFSSDLNQELATINLKNNSIENDSLKNSIEKKKSEIQASHDAYILEQLAVPLKNKVKGELEEQFGKQLKEVEVFKKPQDGSEAGGVIVHVTVENVKRDAQSIEAVKEVTISTQPSTEEQENPEHRKLKQYLSEQWEIPIEQIFVEEGGS